MVSFSILTMILFCFNFIEFSRFDKCFYRVLQLKNIFFRIGPLIASGIVSKIYEIVFLIFFFSLVFYLLMNIGYHVSKMHDMMDIPTYKWKYFLFFLQQNESKRGV